MKNYISIEGKQFDLPDELVNKIRGELTQPKAKTCDDVYRSLFKDKMSFYLSGSGEIRSEILSTRCCDTTNCTTEKQAQKLIAINKLMNVEKYLNGGWVPDWNNSTEEKFCIKLYRNKDIGVQSWYIVNWGTMCFKTNELAQQAINILGEETIRLALSTDW